MDGGGLSLLAGGCGGLSAHSADASTVVDADQTNDLELGLGLSLGGKLTNGWGQCGRILTAKDFPSHGIGNNKKPNPKASISCSSKKRTVDSVSHEGGASPTSPSQVVGWPPIRAYRMNSLVNLAKAARGAEDDSSSNNNNNNNKATGGGGGNGEKEKSSPKDSNMKKKICNGEKTTNSPAAEKGHLGFVKVNMDGVPIGRKIDLNAHGCYETLAQTLEDMFFRSTPALNSIGGGKQQATKHYMLLDGSSEFVLTYEDKDGDWMLVGDVPWQMFLSSVKRLRIMRTSEANGLAAPRFEERSERQRSKPSYS